MTDILIIGAGPSALALAAAAAGAQGMSVRCVAPQPQAPWPQNYGAWQDEIADLTLPVSRRWSAAAVHLQADTPLHIERGYVQLDTAALQAQLFSAATAAGVTLTAGRVASVDADGGRVSLDDGRVLTGRIVVDAAGHGPGFVQRTGRHAPAWQVAYGQHLRVQGGHPWPLDTMGFMDLRTPPGGGDLWRQGPPTFLYVMPLDAEHVFVEETALIARPAPDMALLEARLTARLAWLGLSPAQCVPQAEEHCRIQMLGAEPVLGQPVLGFGAAGGMIHPATGYLLPRMLRTAPSVAAALAQGGAAAGWAALWPAERRRQWALYRFGAELLCTLGQDEVQRFFAAYFALPAAQWQGFLAATLPASGMAHAMATLFSLATPDIRRRLIQAGTSSSGVSLLRGMVLA